MTDATFHSKKSPSKFERIRLCPGSFLREQKYPESPAGQAAIDGTHSHTLLENCLKQLRPPESFLGETLTDHEGSFVVTQDRIDRIRVATDYLNRRWKEANADGFNAQIHSESRIESMSAFGRDDMGGTIDVHIVCDGMLEVIDYKDGMGAVDLPCDQLDIYSLLLLSKYKDEFVFHTVRQTIIQPKLSYRGENGVISIDVPVSELQVKRQMFIDAAEQSEREDAPLNPGEKQCKYCKHKGNCEALIQHTLESSGIVFENLAEGAANKDPHELSNEKLKELIEAAPLIRQLLEAAEAEALRRFEAGIPVPGLKAVRGRGSCSWAFSDEEMVEKLKKMMPKEAIIETKVISPAKIEKARWTKRDGTVMQLTPRQLETLNKDYIKKSEGKIQIVPESDDRPAVTFGAVHLFSHVTGQETTQMLKLPDWLMPF